MSTSQTKPGTGFWTVSVIALLWNLIGVFFYLQQAYMTEADLAALPENQQPLYENIPAWVTGAFAIAVFGGTLGAILLLLRKRGAKTVFVISLIAVIIQMIYNLVLSDALEILGATAAIMPAMVLVIAIFLVVYSNQQIQKGVLK